jgi:hypothetical protein
MLRILILIAINTSIRLIPTVLLIHYGLLDALRAYGCAQMRPSIGS